MTPSAPPGEAWREAYQAHHRWLWGLGYRMLGTAADAEDLVQDTFARAWERQPDAVDALGPWLGRVATNLARDRLRRRQRRAYVGPWLPGPVADPDGWLDAPLPTHRDPAGRYGLRESASLAFLTALEALTPFQRAVLLLRDVFDLTGAETATTLASTPGSVKVALHRARRTMAGQGSSPGALDPERKARTAAIFMRFLAAVEAGDLEAVRALLTDDAVARSDGGGQVYAALKPVCGADRVARLILGLANRTAPFDRRFEWLELNGLPALCIAFEAPAGWAPRSVMQVSLRGDRIAQTFSVLAPAKLTAVPWPGRDRG